MQAASTPQDNLDILKKLYPEWEQQGNRLLRVAQDIIKFYKPKHK